MIRATLFPARLPTARTVVALLLGGTLAASGISLSYWAGGEKDEAESALVRMQRQRAQLATETEQLRQQQPALQAALVHWKALAARGALLPPAPAMWSSEAARIFARHDIEAETLRFTSPPALERGIETSSARILTHAADIDVGLRHEGRLIPLLTALMAAHGAVVLPRACTLARNDDDAVKHIQARCRLDWLTIATPPQDLAR